MSHSLEAQFGHGPLWPVVFRLAGRVPPSIPPLCGRFAFVDVFSVPISDFALTSLLIQSPLLN
jgi:hypothetical protein